MVSQIELHTDFHNERDWFSLFLPYKYKPALPSAIKEGKGRQRPHGRNVNIISLQNENVPVDSYSAGTIIIFHLWNMDNWTELICNAPQQKSANDIMYRDHGNTSTVTSFIAERNL